MLIWYVLIGSIVLIAALLWSLKIISTTYMDLYEKGLVALKKNDPKRAVELFKKSLMKNPDFTEAKYNLGLAYMGFEEYVKARECFEQVLAETPDDFSAMFNLALVCQLDELYDEALELYQKAILADPQDVDCYLNIAIIYFDKKEYQKSLEFLGMAKDISPEKIETLFIIARCKDEMCTYENEEETDAVLLEYESIMAMTDNLPDGFDLALAKAYAKAGRVIQSIEQCAQVLMNDYFNDDAYRLMALIQIIRNDPVSAKKTLAKAIDIEPDIAESYNLLSYAHLRENNK